MAKYLDGTGLGQLWTAIKSGFISTGGGVISGKLTVTAPSTGETEINQNLEAITIAPKQTRNGAAGVYYPGIAFNHMVGYNNSTYYNIGTQAWIGLKLHSTPGSELSYLVFATKPGTGVSGTGNDRPIERMNIAPDGTVKVLGDLYSGKFIKTGSTDAYVLLGAGGTKAVSDFATSDHTHPYIPTSSESTFVHKTGSETITGQKNFSTSTNTVPLIISRGGSADNENLKIGVDDGTVHFLHTQDETVADFLFTSTVTDTERAEGKGTNAASHNIRLALGYNRSAIYLDDTYTVIHSGNYTSYVNTTNFPGLNKTGTVTSVSTGTGLTGGDITSTGTISINSTYQSYISHGETAYGWGNHANGGYVKTTTDQSISGAKTFSDLRVNNIPQDTAMPYFLGIEAFADGGRVKWVSKDDTKVGYATTAGSANSVAWGNISGKPDTYTPASHTHSYLFTEQISANQSGVSWAQGYATTNPKSFIYNTNGAEYSYLVGMNTNNNYGTILKMGYTDKYLRILRKSGGAWQSEDWEKIWAGYADSAGSASSVAWSNVSSKPDTATRWPAWSEVTGKPDTFTPSSHNHNDNYTYKFSYTLPTQKGVRITFSSNATVLISVCGSNSGGQLVIIGTGYGEGGRIRNQFTELVSCSLFDWCIPDSNSISRSVEIFSRRDSNSTVWVQSPESVTFTEIDALTSAKENATLLTSKNYNSWAASVGHNHSGVYSEVGHTHSYLPLSGGTISGTTSQGSLFVLNTTASLGPAITQQYNGTTKSYYGYYPSGGYTYLSNEVSKAELRVYDGGDLKFSSNYSDSSKLYNVIHTGNYSTYCATSGHNHDSVYLKLSGGIITGPLTINSSVNNNYNEGIRITRAGNNWAGITFGSTGTSGAPTGGWFVATNPSNQFIINPDDSGNTTGLTLNKGGDLKWRNNTVWHSGNDGSGSGLDADTLDGYHASKFLLDPIWNEDVNVAAEGWYRVARAKTSDMVRGITKFYLAIYGGSWSPNYAKYTVYGTWSRASAYDLHVESNSQTFRGLRTTYEGDYIYIEVYFKNSITGAKLTVPAENKINGINVSNGWEWFSGNLSAGGGTEVNATAANVTSGHTRNSYITSSGFIKINSSNDYLLLGGGGHKAVSDFSLSTHTHSNYALVGHSHSEYAASGHSHSEFMYRNGYMGDFNADNAAGVYFINPSATNKPDGDNWSNYGICLVAKSPGDTCAQMVWDYSSGRFEVRVGNNNGTNWKSWRQVMYTDMTLTNSEIDAIMV